MCNLIVFLKMQFKRHLLFLLLFVFFYFSWLPQFHVLSLFGSIIFMHENLEGSLPFVPKNNLPPTRFINVNENEKKNLWISLAKFCSLSINVGVGLKDTRYENKFAN